MPGFGGAGNRRGFRREVTVAPPWLTLPNVLTLLRVPLVIPAAWFLWRREHVGVAIVLIGAAVITDVLDGLLARATRQVSDFGKKCDPVADKVSVAVVGVVLVLKYGVPWWILAATVARDVAFVVTAAIVIKKVGRVVTANWWGKAAAGAMAAYGLAVIVFPGTAVTTVLLWLVAALLIISSAGYAADLARTLKANPNPGGGLPAAER